MTRMQQPAGPAITCAICGRESLTSSPPGPAAACTHCGNLLTFPAGEVSRIILASFPILDEVNMAVFDRISELMVKAIPRELLLDFRAVQFISSAALGRLILLASKVKKLGGHVAVCNLERVVHEVFEITQINKLFEVRD